jgi:hypothetical protein
MPLIYSIGLLEDFLKALFFPYAASLWTARRYCMALREMYVVVLAVVVCGLMVFLYFLHYDYLSSRYLIIIALWVSPLVGQGTVMLEDKCRNWRWRKTSLTVLAFIFLLAPLYRSVAKGMGEDQSIALTGRWLSDQPEIRQVGWAVNDLRYFIYAGKRINFDQKRSEAITFSKLLSERNFAAIENRAKSAGQGIIAIRTSKKELGSNPEFKHFHEIKQIEGRRSVVTIYADPSILKFAPERLESTVD